MNATQPNAKNIFLEVLEIKSPEERSAYLEGACGQDSALRAEVEGLLLAAEQAGSFMQGPAVSAANTQVFPSSVTEGPGTVIGPYKLLQQIGEGGMGVVFMAAQEKPVQRTVALKIIKPGMDTRQVIARFEAERQALAMMDHPNIARVIDAGTTDTGRPYFVMDLVKGVPLTEYCDQNHLTIRQRLELFTQVCQAVQHAHQKGIIHRDLKPSNVLVAEYDGRPVPKIIDFGVAKATAQKLTERTMFTEYGQLVGTFEYMSPEQARFNQLDVDTRSDIYSLGVLLYELLAGSTPLEKERLRSAAFDEILRLISEEDPPKPSTRLSRSGGPSWANLAQGPAGRSGPANLATIAANRQSEPARLTKELRGELDWIVMKCLDKDRNRRYESASALAADIAYYLSDEAVQARPSTRSYRLRKFVLRNKVAVIAAFAVAGTLAVGLTLATLGLVRARTEAIRSDQVARFLKEMLSAAGPGVARGRDASLLREILENTATRVASDLHDQPEVQGDLRFTLAATYEDIGDYRLATTLYQSAVESYRSTLGDENAKLARALGSVGRCQNAQGHFSTAQANTELALDIARREGDPETLASVLYDRARSLAQVRMGSRESVPFLREAIGLRKKLNSDPEALADAMRELSSSLLDINIAEAESLVREALALHSERLRADHPKVLDDRFLLGQVLMIRRRASEAESILRDAYELCLKVHKPDHDLRPRILTVLASALDAQGKTREAVELYRSEMEAGDLAWFQLAVLLLRDGQLEEYREHCHRFLARAAGAEDSGTADKAAKSALLLPVDGVDFELACQLADLAASAREEWMDPWGKLVKSLAEYRRGRYESASEWAQGAITASQDGDQCRAAAWFIEASACARLGRMNLARSALHRGERLANRRNSDANSILRWTDWIIADMLKREAEGAMTEPPQTNSIHSSKKYSRTRILSANLISRAALRVHVGESTIALKIIKPGMDTRQVIARFEAERQALAMMDHPNIARVIDAGTTDTGRPYFVMDLVKGVPLTEYCDQNHLTIRQRLELFAQVCQADVPTCLRTLWTTNLVDELREATKCSTGANFTLVSARCPS